MLNLAEYRKKPQALADFLPLLDWPRFRRRTLHRKLHVFGPHVAALGCADEAQALLWLLRTKPLLPNGQVDPAIADGATLRWPMPDGSYRATLWDTRTGRAPGAVDAQAAGGTLTLDVPAFAGDLALAVRRL